jgi:hypothetical protein
VARVSSNDEREKVLAEMKLTDEEIEAGARFSPVIDPEDDRWLLVTIRQPRIPGQEILPPETGANAQWRAMKFNIASTAGILRMLVHALPVHLVQMLALEPVADALDSIGGALHGIDEQRRNPQPDPDAS